MTVCDGCQHYPCTTTDEKLILRCPAYSPPPKKPTNADRIRAMSFEELAKWLARIEWTVLEKQPAITEYAMRMDWLDWLKSPVEVEE